MDILFSTVPERRGKTLSINSSCPTDTKQHIRNGYLYTISRFLPLPKGEPIASESAEVGDFATGLTPLPTCQHGDLLFFLTFPFN